MRALFRPNERDSYYFSKFYNFTSYLQGYSYYGTEGKINCRFSSTRREEARQWTDNYSRHLWSELDIETDSSIQESFYFPGVNIVCGNPASITKSAIVRQAYYRHIGVTWDESNPLKVKQCSWVDVSHSVWRNFLGAYFWIFVRMILKPRTR
jgi:hypothetical protein